MSRRVDQGPARTRESASLRSAALSHVARARRVLAVSQRSTANSSRARSLVPRASRTRAQDFTWEQLVAILGTIDYWRRVWSGLDASLGPPTDDDAAARGKKSGAAHRDIETATARLLAC